MHISEGQDESVRNLLSSPRGAADKRLHGMGSSDAKTDAGTDPKILSSVKGMAITEEVC